MKKAKQAARIDRSISKVRRAATAERDRQRRGAKRLKLDATAR
jgi:hypothetical protein